MTATKINRLTEYAAKLVADAGNVSVTETAGILWVGCDVFNGMDAAKRRSRPIGTNTTPVKYLKEEIRRWSEEIQ